MPVDTEHLAVVKISRKGKRIVKHGLLKSRGPGKNSIDAAGRLGTRKNKVCYTAQPQLFDGSV